MPLKAIVDSLDTVPKEAHGFYTQVSDEKSPLKGKYRLDVEPAEGFELDNVQALKSALGTERGEKDKFSNLVKSFEGLDASKVREQLKRLQELEALDPNKEADKIAASKFDALKAQLTAKHAEELAKLSGERDGLFGEVKNLRIEAAAINAIAKHKGTTELLLPLIERHARLEMVDGKYVVKVVDSNGNPRIKDAQGNPMGIEDLVAEMKESPIYGRAFEGSGKGGAGTQPSNGGGGAGKNLTRAQFDAMAPAARQKAMAEGAKITD